MDVVVNDRVKRRIKMCESEGGCGSHSHNTPRGEVVGVMRGIVVLVKVGVIVTMHLKE